MTTTQKKMVWAWPTRAFHWLLALGFISAYLLGENDNFRQFHFAFGALVGILAVMRIFYGIIGPRYSRFRDFPISLRNQTAFVKSIFSKQNIYAGHNPLASVVMLAIMIVGFLTAASGYMLYLNESQSTTSAGFYFPEEAHEVFANIFLVLVIFHLAGIFTDLLIHGKSGSFFSIFNGYKAVDTEDARSNLVQKTYGVLWISLAVIVFFLAFSLPPLSGNSDRHNEKTGHEQSENDDD